MEFAISPQPTADPALPVAVDPLRLRRCLSQFATGVTVITYALDGMPRGATVNSFISVSMDPPLVLVAIGRSANAAAALAATPFVVNVLTADQLEVALHFAGRPQADLAIPWEQDGGAPRLRNCAARITCTPWDAVAAGDHMLFLGRVTEFEQGEAEALLFHRGQFRSTGLTI